MLLLTLLMMFPTTLDITIPAVRNPHKEKLLEDVEGGEVESEYSHDD